MTSLLIVDAVRQAAAIGALLVSAVLLFQLSLEDVESRLVSAGKCYAFVAFCLGFQLCANGLSQIALGAVWSAIMLAACWLANAVHARKARKADAIRVPVYAGFVSGATEIDRVAIGGGDVVCMVGLCFASGQFILPGVLCFCVVVGAFSLVGIAFGKLRSSDAIPLVPFFFAWLVPVALLALLA